MDPLISIITPIYNASGTLPMALKSLVFQSYQNWECILVDDGSEDNPQIVVDQFRDPRFIYHRLDVNLGRGAARQYGLNHANGEYLCFLDADDWIYPEKLREQLALLGQYKQLGLISSGMAVVDDKNELKGIYGIDDLSKEFQEFDKVTKVSPLNIPFASAMIRMEVAREAYFDPNLKRSEDADFLLQILFNHPYGYSSKIQYVYRAFTELDKADVIGGYQSRIQVLKKYRNINPIQSRIQICRTKIIMLIYKLLFGLGMGNELFKKRFRQPSEMEQLSYQDVLSQLTPLSEDNPK
jgi:glycosyltransferase involved in cell wall biosynthesis